MEAPVKGPMAKAPTPTARPMAKLDAAGAARRPVAAPMMTRASRNVASASQARAAPTETPTDYEVGPSLKTTFVLGEPVACGFRLEGADAAGGLRLVIRDGEREVRGVDVYPPAPGEDARPSAGSFKVKLPVEGLPAGDYVLVVLRKGAGGAESDAGSTPLHLRPAKDEGV